MARPTHSPYNFVPLPDTSPERTKYPGLDRLGKDSYSGLLVCDLEVLTRLFTADHQRGDEGQRLLPFLRNGEGNPILQATTLKGMIRSLYEAAFPSCLPLAAASGSSQKVQGETQYHWTLPDSYKHASCDRLENLCPACRLFGIAEGDKVHAQGRAFFSDAALTKGALQEEIVKLAELSSPKPHSEIYGRNGKIRGRKLYYHHDPAQQPEVETLGPRSNAISEFAPPGTVFTFTLRFENLSKSELDRLIACLTLDATHAHKLGMAKPLGYGSCTISIRKEGSFVAEGGSRYRTWGSEKTSFDESQWQIEEGWLQGALEKILRRDREGVGLTGYPPLKGYKDLDFDEDGRYVQSKTVSKASPAPSFPQFQSPAEVIAGILELAQAPAKAVPSSQQKKRVALEVVSYENGRYTLRNPETKQEGIVFKNRGVFWQVGQIVKVRVVKSAPDGRILEIQP